MGLTLLAGVTVWVARDAVKADAVYAGFDARMRKLGGSADLMMTSLRKASQGMISDAELVSGANRAMLLIGDQVARKLPALMAIAARASREMGESQEYMWWSITTGIGRAQPRILDNLGMTMDANQIYDNWAASIGKTRDELTKMEQSMALTNAVIDWGRQKFGDLSQEMEGFDVELQQLLSSIKNLKRDIGTLMAKELMGLISTLGEVVEVVRLLGPAFQEQAIAMVKALALLAVAFKVFGWEMAAGFAIGLKAAPHLMRALGRVAEGINLLTGGLIPGAADFAKYARETTGTAEEFFAQVRKGLGEVGEATPVFGDILKGLDALRGQPKDIIDTGDAMGDFALEAERAGMAVDDQTQKILRFGRALSLVQISRMDTSQVEAEVESWEKRIATLRLNILEAENLGNSTDELNAQLEEAEWYVDALGLRYDMLGGAQRDASAASDLMTMSLGQQISALVSMHPLVISLTGALQALNSN
jgi:hypothetical protein